MQEHELDTDFQQTALELMSSEQDLLDWLMMDADEDMSFDSDQHRVINQPARMEARA